MCAAAPSLSNRLQKLFAYRSRRTAPTSTRSGVREVRPDLRGLFAAARTGEERFDIGEPDIIGPAVGIGLDVMAASVIAAIDIDVADAGCAHLAEGDFLL